jgi:Family of unknown function (DUF6497)
VFLSHRLLLCPVLVVLAGAGGCEDKAAPVDGAIAVPSGREVTFLDVITNVPGSEGATARFRFIAPGIGPDDAEPAGADMQVLCDSYALPRTEAMVPPPNQIIITLSAAAVPFGEAAPDVTQFFEAYAIEGGACIWQVF